jgi:hypothetical protein
MAIFRISQSSAKSASVNPVSPTLTKMPTRNASRMNTSEETAGVPTPDNPINLLLSMIYANYAYAELYGIAHFNPTICAVVLGLSCQKF